MQPTDQAAGSAHPVSLASAAVRRKAQRFRDVLGRACAKADPAARVVASPGSTGRIWPKVAAIATCLTPNLLTPNEVAGTLRLVNKAAAAQFPGPQHTVIRLSQPVPCHAFSKKWQHSGAAQKLPLRRRVQLLCLTAASDNLQVAYNVCDCVVPEDAIVAAAAAGQMQTFKLLLEWYYKELSGQDAEPNVLFQDSGVLRRAAEAAAQNRQVDMCKWLCGQGGSPAFNMWPAKAAARAGDEGLMNWILQDASDTPPPPDSADLYAFELDRTSPSPLQQLSWHHAKSLLVAAAEGFELPTLQRLYLQWTGGRPERRLSPQRQERITAAAAASPTPDWAAKVEWLEDHGCTQRSELAASLAAARPDATERLAWLRRKGFLVGDGAAAALARVGNAPALRSLLSEDVQLCGEGAAYEAAAGGHLAALQALWEAGCEVDVQASVDGAARGGHLHVVAWLVETLLGGNARRLNPSSFEAAAESGSIELMAWLREHGCRWNKHVINGAARGGCPEALEWLRSKRCRVSGDGYTHITACCNGDLATLKTLRALRVPWTRQCARDLADRVDVVPVPALRWAIANDRPIDLQRAEGAVRRRKVDNGYYEVQELLECRRMELRLQDNDPYPPVVCLYGWPQQFEPGLDDPDAVEYLDGYYSDDYDDYGYKAGGYFSDDDEMDDEEMDNGGTGDGGTDDDGIDDDDDDSEGTEDEAARDQMYGGVGVDDRQEDKDSMDEDELVDGEEYELASG